MSNTGKKVSMAVIDVLKSIMDDKAKKLQATIADGRRAKSEEPLICEQITALRRFVVNSRYDRNEMQEAESDLADYEQQAAGIRAKINRADNAERDIVWVDKFNVSYAQIKQRIKNQPRINILKEQLAAIESDIAKIEHGIDICELNMAPGVYSDEVAQQAQEDMKKYQLEYASVVERWRRVANEIRELER